MPQRKDISISFFSLLTAKLGDIAQLFKVRLGSLVIFSSVIGYLIVAAGNVDFLSLVMLSLGGFLVTGASNAINQIFEKDIDVLMTRTKNRPIPTGRMSAAEAALYAGIAAVVGLSIITFYFNPIAGSLSALALISYAFIYTPMKKMSTLAVFVGAIPGALPPMIGAVAFEGTISYWAILLFSIQFIWQFPHFWAIAWVSFEDYLKAGIMLLPSREGKGKYSALMTIIYTFMLLPVGAISYYMGLTGWIGSIVVALCGVYFLYCAVNLYRKCNDAAARKLMFASFIYLPIVLLALLIDKVA